MNDRLLKALTVLMLVFTVLIAGLLITDVALGLTGEINGYATAARIVTMLLVVPTLVLVAVVANERRRRSNGNE